MTLSTSGFSPARALALFATVGAAAMSVVGSARADVPPPPGHVEQCTVELQQQADAICEACGSYYATVEKCPAQYASTPFQKRCQSYGASVWTEVWCRPRTPADPALVGATAREVPHAAETPAGAAPSAASTTAQDDDSCSVAAPGAPGRRGSAAWLMVAALVLAAGARRR